MVKDIYLSIDNYKRALKRLQNNEKLPLINRNLAIEWIKKKEKELSDGFTKTQMITEKLRQTKTLLKYCYLMTNLCFWFKDFTKIDEKELIKFKEDFNLDKIKSLNGKTIKCKSDYFNKLIKSDFFRNFLGHELIVKKVFNGKIRKNTEEVEFITYDDFNILINHAYEPYHKATLYLLYSSGIRVGTLLNLKKSDFELKFNVKTKVHYYIIHIKSEITKSKENMSIPIVIPNANNFLTEYLKNLDENDYVINYSYSQIRNMIDEISIRANITTKPNNKRLHPHILRKSTPIYLLNNKYSVDQVKAMLGHKPSSTVIDRYVNYLGLQFEPEVTKVQTDTIITFQKELEETRKSITVLQHENDQLKERQVKIEKALELINLI